MCSKGADAAKLFVDFVNETGSPYHSVLACANLLRKSGFQELHDSKPWTLARGGKYYVTKDGADIMAFVVGGKFLAEGKQSGASIVGAHTDSPCLRLRPVSKMGGSGMLQVGIQTYGGGLWHTWFDRPLGLAGKVVVRDPANKNLVERLVHITKPICILPNLAIHLASADERKAFAVNTETQLQPVLCSKFQDDARCGREGGREDAPKEGPFARHQAALLEAVARELSCAPEDIVDADLCLMDAQPANIVGVYEEFVSAPRIDNQLSTWAATKGLCDFADQGSLVDDCVDICVAVAFDHEEVGSSSAVGADGNTLPAWMERIFRALSVPDAVRPEVYARSMLISADCAHGLHPNYAGKHQSEHKPEFHKGIVIKTNANQRYATTPLTASLFREVCARASVPVQDFIVRNDTPCGSTIGPILSSKLGIRTIDIGAPQWAMHSCRETCATTDCSHLYECCKAFFETFREIDDATAVLWRCPDAPMPMATKQDLNDKLKEILSATPLTFKMPMQTLDENCNPALARCVEKMAEHPECGVRILCTTENPAGIWESAKLCKDLALFRAHAVKQALVLQGATNVITCVGAGANGACTCIIEEVDIEEVDIEEQKLSCAHLVFKNPETNADMEVLFEKRPLGFEFNRTAPITISKVDAGSHGEEKGVKEGWIIERINDTSFTNESNFQAVYDILMKAVKGLSDGHVKI